MRILLVKPNTITKRALPQSGGSKRGRKFNLVVVFILGGIRNNNTVQIMIKRFIMHPSS